ncbi:uncharacterized protein cubi_00617 [Cryptosporidium ubiquitum]|uniref:Uncharacterized protein n=1 Tax=Cryptosporidium ubiquitum TaxID=857276 RepID=A0A1J4MC55_9CRYT|nr:uncharacterized protein cubi_00617 [Cryptosporidium ubiquitum]OII71809.1 hypothetical protein cubi_00617 [Cryptosporidium ubiquitum]
MILQSIAQILNLTIISNIGLEPWILLALKCLGGLIFFSAISLFSLIREPLPIDNNAKILSYCYSIGQMSVMGMYFLCGSIDDSINNNFMLLAPTLVVFGIFYDYKDIYFKKNGLWKNIIYLFLTFCQIITLVISIINFIQFKKNWVFLIYLVLLTAIFLICKIAYYFAIVKINKNKIKPLEISAVSILNISKVGIPIGVLVHTWRMRKLLPNHEYKLFLLDLARCDRSSAFKILLSSFISFGIIFPLQVLTIPNISFLEYILYSIFPNVLFSQNYISIGFIVALILMAFNIYQDNKTSENFVIQLEPIK